MSHTYIHVNSIIHYSCTVLLEFGFHWILYVDINLCSDTTCSLAMKGIACVLSIQENVF